MLIDFDIWFLDGLFFNHTGAHYSAFENKRCIGRNAEETESVVSMYGISIQCEGHLGKHVSNEDVQAAVHTARAHECPEAGAGASWGHDQ